MNYFVLESLNDGVSGTYEGHLEYYFPEVFYHCIVRKILIRIPTPAQSPSPSGDAH